MAKIMYGGYGKVKYMHGKLHDYIVMTSDFYDKKIED